MTTRKIKRKSKGKQPELRPYGFCCRPDSDAPRYAKWLGPQHSLPSLDSLHECPALRLLAEVVEPRPPGPTEEELAELAEQQRSSMLLATSGGGKFDKLPTESELDLLLDEERRRRQEEYERKMDRLAEIGRKRKKEEARRNLTCLAPCWYTEFSQHQLKILRKLEDEMFKDKSEKTIKRTWNCLNAMGMISDLAKVDSKQLWKLLDRFSADPLKFLNEIYKTLTGHYAEEEPSRFKYQVHERIILSAMAFFELPNIIMELHKRLPPVDKSSFQPKPKRPAVIMPKKMSSPFLEKLRLPFDWRLYKKDMVDWYIDCMEKIRPIAVLPKEAITDAEDTSDHSKGQDQKLVCGKSPKASKEKPVRKSTESEDIKSASTDESSLKETDENVRRSEEEGYFAEPASQQLFPEKTDWTSPPTFCPYKYRKILNEKGPLQTDREFFTELQVSDAGNKDFPEGRDNLTFNMQQYLLNVEADFFTLTEEANKITGAVDEVLREINRMENLCDACCPCRQTKKTHSKWHASKSPYNLIDGVLLDEDNTGQVIGAVTMHSPPSSLSSVKELACSPSKDKIVKNKIVGAAIVGEDGQVVNLIDGYTKALEHIPQECIEPGPKELKNVPPCDCDTEQPADPDIYPNIGQFEEQYENVCFGKKFRPNELAAYQCPEFNRKEEKEIEVQKYDETSLIHTIMYDDFSYREGEEEEEYRDYGISDLFDIPESEPRIICKGCGRGMKPNCVEKFGGKVPKKKDLIRCKCESLTEFLQMDITKVKCIKPEKPRYKRESKIIHKISPKSHRRTSNRTIQKHKKDHKKKHENEKTKSVDNGEEGFDFPKRTSRNSQVIKKKHRPSIKKSIGESSNKEDADSRIVEEGGPYGKRTKSEEALPTQLTVAYLTPRHPPDLPADKIPVHESGRACKCRENRNNRKKLIYNVGALDSAGQAVVEGVHWLTPVPSIRRSQEYIPEYELYDSPYGKRRAPDAKPSYWPCDEDQGNKDDVRKKGWDLAVKDEYLTEFFTKEPTASPCGPECGNCYEEPEPRKLKVMNAVCECRYERKIVKRREDKIHWAERQQRLKSMEKESYLHITEMTKPPDNGEVERELGAPEDQAQLVIAAVTMQSPCITPSSSRPRTNLPYTPIKVSDKPAVEKVEEEKKLVQSTKDDSPVKPKTPSKNSESKKQGCVKEKTGATNEHKKPTHLHKKNHGHRAHRKSEEERRNDEKEEGHAQESNLNVEQEKRDSLFYNTLEEDLFEMVHEELKKMAEDEFISVKLPNYHKMPQILYWISYRVRGMHFTKTYKKQCMRKTLKVWKLEKSLERMEIEPLVISDKERKMLDFDSIYYWKRKIAKKHAEIYSQMRQEVVTCGRNKWYTMEYGKFPNVLFKQAFFTYFPTREKDAFVFRSNIL